MPVLTDADIYTWMDDYAITKLVAGLRTRIDKGRKSGTKKLLISHDELDTLLSQIGGHNG
jgi:tmRNA-binding protein